MLRPKESGGPVILSLLSHSYKPHPFHLAENGTLADGTNCFIGFDYLHSSEDIHTIIKQNWR